MEKKKSATLNCLVMQLFLFHITEKGSTTLRTKKLQDFSGYRIKLRQKPE